VEGHGMQAVWSIAVRRCRGDINGAVCLLLCMLNMCCTCCWVCSYVCNKWRACICACCACACRAEDVGMRNYVHSIIHQHHPRHVAHAASSATEPASADGTVRAAAGGVWLRAWQGLPAPGGQRQCSAAQQDDRAV
jgi:hypothetical protein